jgi:hypothetical protein
VRRKSALSVQSLNHSAWGGLMRYWESSKRNSNPRYVIKQYSGLAIHRQVLNRLQNFLLYSSFPTGYKSVDLIRSAWKRFVLIVQPLQFHDNATSIRPPPSYFENAGLRHCGVGPVS